MRQLLKRLALKSALYAYDFGERFAKGVTSTFVNEVIRKRYGVVVPLEHYYSPIPDIHSLKAGGNLRLPASKLPGIDLRVDTQLDNLVALASFEPELQELKSFSEIVSIGYGPGYGEIEAEILFCMIRFLRPRSIVEVGSGVSTYFITEAIRRNEASGHPCKLTCIEPFPRPTLRQLSIDRSINLLAEPVQNIDIGIFQELSEDDICFIDSTHVSKLGSDVNQIYLEILPELNDGVRIHIHDITFPFPSASVDHPMFDLFALWNEAALVQAFLMFNSRFKIELCLSYLHHMNPNAISECYPSYDVNRHYPSSLWLRKQALS
jgi:hypothetical protein